MTRLRTTLLASVAIGSTLTLAACGSGSGSGSGADGDGPVVLGVTLPITGQLSVFAPTIQAGYEAAVADINADGGVEVGGVERQLKLEIRDNKSDPQEVTAQAKSLLFDADAVALLGSVTPPLNIPLSNVAEQEGVPAVMTLTPLNAWRGANQAGWTSAWNIFVDETQTTALSFESADAVQTNKKVALFTDTEEDGEAMGALWEKAAPEHGYEIVSRAKFPVGTTDFSQYIREAQTAGADIVIAQMIPPDGAALWKQMKSLQFAPKIAYCEKCSAVGWPDAVGELSEGTAIFGWWAPELGYPGSEELFAKLEPTFGNNQATQAAVASYAVVEVLASAVEQADSTEPEAVNAALAELDLETVVGPIDFADDNSATLQAFMTQWQGTTMPIVFPADKASAEFVAPAVGQS